MLLPTFRGYMNSPKIAASKFTIPNQTVVASPRRSGGGKFVSGAGGGVFNGGGFSPGFISGPDCDAPADSILGGGTDSEKIFVSGIAGDELPELGGGGVAVETGGCAAGSIFFSGGIAGAAGEGWTFDVLPSDFLSFSARRAAIVFFTFAAIFFASNFSGCFARRSASCFRAAAARASFVGNFLTYGGIFEKISGLSRMSALDGR